MGGARTAFVGVATGAKEAGKQTSLQVDPAKTTQRSRRHLQRRLRFSVYFAGS